MIPTLSPHPVATGIRVHLATPSRRTHGPGPSTRAWVLVANEGVRVRVWGAMTRVNGGVLAKHSQCPASGQWQSVDATL